MCVYRKNDFKESAHTVMDAGKFESVGWAGRLSPMERLMLPFKSEGCLLPLARGGQSLVQSGLQLIGGGPPTL